MSSEPADFDQVPTVVQAGAPAEGIVHALVVSEGPDKGRTFVLDDSMPTSVLIGQSPVCDVRLTDRTVSRRHAALDRIGDAIRVRDLESTNGTYVDHVRVVEAHLLGGETVGLGGTALRLDITATSRNAAPLRQSFGRFLGASPEMRRLYPLCERIAAAPVPVIIEGETGTGKEVLAEALHEQGPRSSGPFVVFDCTAVAANLLESELFGHERGAFTGATTTRKGAFEQADGGTLLIDEVGDLDLALQPKLLRVIERSEVQRVGGSGRKTFDVRVFAATRRNLDHEVEAGRFRDDLFHRLAVARIELPPLRRRQGDVSLLVRHFWERFGGDPTRIPPHLLSRWQDSPWPGNVRELRNAVARYLALGDLDHDPGLETSFSEPGTAEPQSEFDQVIASGLPFTQARDLIAKRFISRYVEFVLAQHGGDVGLAAAASGIGRRYFQMLMARTSR